MRYLLSYQENIQKLKDKMLKLNQIKEQIDEADKKDGGSSRDPNSEKWLKDPCNMDEMVPKAAMA